MIELEAQAYRALVERIVAEASAAIPAAAVGTTAAAPAGVPQGSACAGWIDHTLLRPDATRKDIEALCAEARRYGFASVCVNPVWTALAAAELRGSPVLAGTVVGFPLGAESAAVKRFQAGECIKVGAEELDMVLNLGALKEGADAVVADEVRAVAEVCHQAGARLKVILETALLSDEEKVRACRIAQAGGADFVKTSTGFGNGGATIQDVALLRATVGAAMGVKASGGIRTYAALLAMVRAGANRIGTSAGVQIVEEALAPSGRAAGGFSL